MTTTESDKYVLVGDADLSVTLTRDVYGLFAYQPLTPCVGLEFWLSPLSTMGYVTVIG